MNRSESITNLAKALVAAQLAMKPAAKDSLNPHLKSRYADLASIWDACRAELTKNGLCVIQGVWGGSELHTMLLHVSGEWIVSITPIKARSESAQDFGSGLTYARRYALSAMVGVVADDDDDGHRASAPAKPKETPPDTGNIQAQIARALGAIEAAQSKADIEMVSAKLAKADKAIQSAVMGAYTEKLQAINGAT